MKGQLNWFVGGLVLGCAFLVAVWVVKPIGVSTQYVVVDALAWNLVDANLVKLEPDSKSGFSSPNAYLNRDEGKIAKEVAKPLNYGLVFVVSMILGAWISARMGGPKPGADERSIPAVWRQRFAGWAPLRFGGAFLAGFLVLFGARLAGGCTSGHMMSGMMQTSISGYLFAGGVFATAIPIAILVFGRK